MFLLMVDSLENESDRDFILGVYQDNKRLMYYTAKKYVNEQEECEEIVQDCICKLINKIDVIRKLNQYALLSYIVSTVRNSAITYGLQKKKEQEMRKNAQVGDEITTIGGICGRIVAVKDEIDSIVIETGSDRSKMLVKRWAIGSVDTVHEDDQA